MTKRNILVQRFYDIASANNWHRHHTLKNLAVAISVESSELLREFQWADSDELPDVRNMEKIGNEMADVYMYLLVMADKLNIDLDDVALQKSEANLSRFLKK